MKMPPKIILIVAIPILVSACSPEIGSTKWCEKMDETAKGDWTANESLEYAKNCVFRKPE